MDQNYFKAHSTIIDVFDKFQGQGGPEELLPFDDDQCRELIDKGFLHCCDIDLAGLYGLSNNDYQLKSAQFRVKLFCDILQKELNEQPSPSGQSKQLLRNHNTPKPDDLSTQLRKARKNPQNAVDIVDQFKQAIIEKATLQDLDAAAIALKKQTSLKTNFVEARLKDLKGHPRYQQSLLSAVETLTKPYSASNKAHKKAEKARLKQGKALLKAEKKADSKRTKLLLSRKLVRRFIKNGILEADATTQERWLNTTALAYVEGLDTKLQEFMQHATKNQLIEAILNIEDQVLEKTDSKQRKIGVLLKGIETKTTNEEKKLIEKKPELAQKIRGQTADPSGKIQRTMVSRRFTSSLQKKWDNWKRTKHSTYLKRQSRPLPEVPRAKSLDDENNLLRASSYEQTDEDEAKAGHYATARHITSTAPTRSADYDVAKHQKEKTVYSTTTHKSPDTRGQTVVYSTLSNVPRLLDEIEGMDTKSKNPIQQLATILNGWDSQSPQNKQQLLDNINKVSSQKFIQKKVPHNADLPTVLDAIKLIITDKEGQELDTALQSSLSSENQPVAIGPVYATVTVTVTSKLLYGLPGSTVDDLANMIKDWDSQSPQNKQQLLDNINKVSSQKFIQKKVPHNADLPTVLDAIKLIITDKEGQELDTARGTSPKPVVPDPTYAVANAVPTKAVNEEIYSTPLASLDQLASGITFRNAKMNTSSPLQKLAFVISRDSKQARKAQLITNVNVFLPQDEAMENPSADDLETNVLRVLPPAEGAELKQALNKIKQHDALQKISKDIKIGERTKKFCGFKPEQKLSGLDKIVAVMMTSNETDSKCKSRLKTLTHALGIQDSSKGQELLTQVKDALNQKEKGAGDLFAKKLNNQCKKATENKENQGPSMSHGN